MVEEYQKPASEGDDLGEEIVDNLEQGEDKLAAFRNEDGSIDEESIIKAIQKRDGQRSKLRERLKKLQADLEGYKASSPKKQKNLSETGHGEGDTTGGNKVGQEDTQKIAFQVRERRPDGSPYTTEEVDLIFAMAKGYGVTPQEAAQKEEVQAVLEAKAAKVRAEQATPSPSNQPIKVGGKTFKDMTDEEKRTNWSAYVDQIRNRGGRSAE